MKDLEFVGTYCPHCGEALDLSIDTSVEQQQYVEDCQVCCRPMVVTVLIDHSASDAVGVVVRAEND